MILKSTGKCRAKNNHGIHKEKQKVENLHYQKASLTNTKLK